MNGGQQPQQQPIVYAEILITLKEDYTDPSAVSQEISHKNALQQLMCSPGGNVLVVEDASNHTIWFYNMDDLKRVQLTPTRLSIVKPFN
jgi:hypothetical protein